jgi:hypothetical protein
MKHFIYKTIHKNGKYYIGRHSTTNIDDGYIGSGKWPRSIKDKTTLTREILEYAENIEQLIILEEKYLNEHYGKEQCMNASNTSIGAPTGDSNPMRNVEIANKISGENHWLYNNNVGRILLRNRANKLVENGTHNWLGDKNPNKDGAIARRTSANGKNIFQTNNPSIWRSEAGIHHWQHGNSPNTDGKLNKKLVEAGTHNFLGPDTNNKRIAAGTHNFVGSASNLKMLENGTHPSQQKKTCVHCSKTISIGMYKRWHGDNCKKKSW